MEEIAFSDWPGQPLDSGGNSWLPAYGFQTPTALLDRDDFLGNPDANYFLQGTLAKCLYLETIHEETSDDLRSESDMSDVRDSPLGWLATDSDADSVICMDVTNDSDCESDREIACPIKRRRQDPFLLLPPDDYQSLSRSSSLLQFESLEKQCQETSSSTPSLYSELSLDSLETPRKSLPAPPAPDPPKLWHSLDNILKAKEKISAENLSEDSGYSEHLFQSITPTSKKKGHPQKKSVFSAYDYYHSKRSLGNFGASCQDLTTACADWPRRVIIEKECHVAKIRNSSASEPNLLGDDVHSPVLDHRVTSVPKNLNFVAAAAASDEPIESIAVKNWDLGTLTMSYRREGSYARAMADRVDLSDDEHSLINKNRPKPHTNSTIVDFDTKVLGAISESVNSIADVYLDDIYRPLRPLGSASTPNLTLAQDQPRKSSLATNSASTSCVSDAEDPLKTKGVHFSPVVSEVNWPESETPTTSPDRESTYSISSANSPDREASIATLTRSLLEVSPRPTLHHNAPAFSPIHAHHSQSQPNLKRRGSQLLKKDSDGSVIKAYVDGDGIQYKHTHLDLDGVAAATVPSLGVKGHVGAGRAAEGSDRPVGVMEGNDAVQRKRSANKFGGFFSRLASFRFSGGKKDDKKAKKNEVKKAAISRPLPPQHVATKNDYIYIPLKGPLPPSNNNNAPSSPKDVPTAATVSSKPPLPRVPPRVVGASVKRGENAQGRHAADQEQQRRRRRTIDSEEESCPRPMEPMGLIETDLDTEVTTVITSTPNVKSRSLLNLGAEPRLGGLLKIHGAEHSGGGGGNGTSGVANKYPASRPHKSMEFLLDKQNLKVVEPPENELQKGERVMSEHQLRVQRSLQKLTVPDWYKHSQVPSQGFLLKKPSNRETRWTGTSTGSKTTSLSSLSGTSPAALSPTAGTQPFIRWSTSKLNSTASSPCASTRSSFNARTANGSVSPSSARSSFSYRQPYMGWRSQERLHNPRTPTERLANSLLAQNHAQEIQTSIKEVTSAIVHYVSGLQPPDNVSPRGSQKLCWLESSFVGVRPLDSPQTPVSLSEAKEPAPAVLRLELQNHGESIHA